MLLCFGFGQVHSPLLAFLYFWLRMHETRRKSIWGCPDFLKIGEKKKKKQLGLDQTKESAFVLLTETAGGNCSPKPNVSPFRGGGGENGI